ncbi:HIRAN domain-containing protein [Facklamia sp. P13069]|uniref:HIRAN domain-containing protein n=1 Tax=Facklamia sp. P13069 TaxID=3421954 RepID=UPI003D170F21
MKKLIYSFLIFIITGIIMVGVVDLITGEEKIVSLLLLILLIICDSFFIKKLIKNNKIHKVEKSLPTNISDLQNPPNSKQSESKLNDTSLHSDDISVPKKDVSDATLSYHGVKPVVKTKIKPKSKYHSYSTYITGTAYENREALIKRLIKQTISEEMLEKYQGLSGKELKEELEFDIIWEYEPFEIELELIPEPDNEYDENAIAVFAEIGGKDKKIGYVPKEDNQYILDLIKKYDCRAYAEVRGGNFKKLNYDGKIEIIKHKYKLTLWVSYKN